MGILLALLLGASSPCADGKCPVPTATVCKDGECGSNKCDAGCKNCPCSGKVVSSKPSVKSSSIRKTVRSRLRLFGRRR